MILEIILSALFFTFLGILYVRGYDIVKKHSPEHLPHFYLIMATIRMLLVASVVALYVFFTVNSVDTIRFAIVNIIMFVVMMEVTLKLRQ